MRKAITPVISVILLIMLVVAITGGAWYWMTNVQGSLQESAGSSIEQTSDLSTNQFSIVSVLCADNNGAGGNGNITISIINTGSTTIASSDSVLVTLSSITGSVYGTNTTVVGQTISSGAAATYTIDGGFGTDLVNGTSYSVRVNIGSASQTSTCTAT